MCKIAYCGTYHVVLTEKNERVSQLRQSVEECQMEVDTIEQRTTEAEEEAESTYQQIDEAARNTCREYESLSVCKILAK